MKIEYKQNLYKIIKQILSYQLNIIESESIMEEMITLYYWDARGLAERIRILLNYCELQYKQVRYTKQNQGDWFNIKKHQVYNKARYHAVSLPFLQDGNTFVSQYQGICTYICLKSQKQQLLGRNLDEKLALTTALTIFRDAYSAYRKYVYEQYGKGDEEQIEDNKQYFKLIIRKNLYRLSQIKAKNIYLCGNQIVWLDIALAQFLQCLMLLDEAAIFKDLDHWKQYQKSVWSIPKIHNYITSDKFKEKPCNNYSAKWI